ncbi:hypothetical protein [Endozoicomonas sp.]|uniref:hypothetical protein n=1 Tax=Endozoicomonas sp. TaxID=1892382 RepID=UPI002884BFFB|nr:hypothetical protein [Endozoicomonas sp.]
MNGSNINLKPASTLVTNTEQEPVSDKQNHEKKLAVNKRPNTIESLLTISKKVHSISESQTPLYMPDHTPHAMSYAAIVKRTLKPAKERAGIHIPSANPEPPFKHHLSNTTNKEPKTEIINAHTPRPTRSVDPGPGYTSRVDKTLEELSKTELKVSNKQKHEIEQKKETSWQQDNKYTDKPVKKIFNPVHSLLANPTQPCTPDKTSQVMKTAATGHAENIQSSSSKPPPFERNLPHAIHNKGSKTEIINAHTPRPTRSVDPGPGYTSRVVKTLEELSKTKPEASDPLQWCITVARTLDLLRSRNRTNTQANHEYFKSMSMPYYQEALLPALTYLEKTANDKHGNQHVYLFNSTVLTHAYLHPMMLRTGSRINLRMKKILLDFIYLEVNYLKTIISFPDKRCATQVMSRLNGLIAEKSPSVSFGLITKETAKSYKNKIAIIKNDMRNAETTLSSKEPIEQAFWDKNHTKAEELIIRHGTYNHFRYLGDLLKSNFGDIMNLSPLVRNPNHNLSILNTMLIFKKEYATTIQEYHPLRTCFYTILSSLLPRIILYFHLNPGKPLFESEVNNINSIIRDKYLDGSCFPLWQQYRKPESGVHRSTITDLEVLAILEKAYAAIDTESEENFDRSAMLLRPLYDKRNEISKLPSIDRIKKSVSIIRPIICRAFTTPVSEHMFSLLRKKPFVYNHVIVKMAQYKERCILFEKYRFLFTETVDNGWKRVLWYVWGVSIRSVMTKELIEKEDLKDLLKLKELCATPSCPNTRYNLKAALINIFEQTNHRPDFFLKFQDQLDALAFWAIAICDETEERLLWEKRKSKTLLKITKQWLGSHPQKTEQHVPSALEQDKEPVLNTEVRFKKTNEKKTISTDQRSQPHPDSDPESFINTLAIQVPQATNLTSPPSQQHVASAATHHQVLAPELTSDISSRPFPIQALGLQPSQPQLFTLYSVPQPMVQMPVIASLPMPNSTAMVEPLIQVNLIPITITIASPPPVVAKPAVQPELQYLDALHYQALYSQVLNKPFNSDVQKGISWIDQVLSRLLTSAGGGDIRYPQVPDAEKNEIISATSMITPWLKYFCSNENEYHCLCLTLNRITDFEAAKDINSWYETLLNTQIRHGNIVGATELTCVFEGLFHVRHMLGLSNR